VLRPPGLTEQHSQTHRGLLRPGGEARSGRQVSPGVPACHAAVRASGWAVGTAGAENAPHAPGGRPGWASAWDTSWGWVSHQARLAACTGPNVCGPHAQARPVAALALKAALAEPAVRRAITSRRRSGGLAYYVRQTPAATLGGLPASPVPPRCCVRSLVTATRHSARTTLSSSTSEMARSPRRGMPGPNDRRGVSAGPDSAAGPRTATAASDRWRSGRPCKGGLS
jgi:hypothetical protein